MLIYVYVLVVFFLWFLLFVVHLMIFLMNYFSSYYRLVSFDFFYPGFFCRTYSRFVSLPLLLKNQHTSMKNLPNCEKTTEILCGLLCILFILLHWNQQQILIRFNSIESIYVYQYQYCLYYTLYICVCPCVCCLTLSLLS